RLRPLIATLHRGRPPAPVHARTLLRASVCTGAWVVGGGRSARAPGSPRDGAAGIHTRGRVVARADTGAAVRPVDRCAPAVAAGPRVVPGAVSVGGIEGIVDGIETAVADVRRIVPTGAPDRAAPADHHAGIAGDGREGDPLVIVVVLDDGDVGHVVRRRARGDLVDFHWHRPGHLPRAIRAPRREPHALEAHVVEVADLDDVLVGVDRTRHARLGDRFEV